MRMRRKKRYTIRRKTSHRFGNEGQAMDWLGLICLLSFRNIGNIETVVSSNCYFSRICFANWVWQESELLTYFYLTRFPTAKNELQNRFETRSRYYHNSERENTVQTKWTFCGGTNHSSEMFFKSFRQEKEKYRAAGDLDNRCTKGTSRKCFRCGSEEHLIDFFPNPPKDNKKRRKKVFFNEKGNRACDNSENNSNQKIYVSMARMYSNEECPSGNFGDSSQLTKLDFGFWSNVPHETRGFRFYSRFIRRCG